MHVYLSWQFHSCVPVQGKGSDTCEGLCLSGKMFATKRGVARKVDE